MYRSASVVLLALGFSLSASGQTADTASTTRAARLTFMQGTVSVAENGNPTGVPAQLNLPLLAGIQLITGVDGQAEVEFEDGSLMRLTPNSDLSLDSLTVQPDGVFLSSLSVLRGLVYCELRATQQYRYTLDAGGDVLSPVENTTVRLNFDKPPAVFSVLDGTAQVERQSVPGTQTASSGYETQVRAGETLRADPNDGNRYFLTQQIAEDSWDQWNEDRDQAAASEAADSTAVRNDYAGAQGYGWSDLDANGSWYDVPGQGPVWQPHVAVDDSGFDPYGNGAWVSYPNTGYVWASSYAWGWTPYRCGNWSYYNSFGWGWAPGSGCGGRGWEFAGGGRPVNVVLGPTGYRPIRVPVGGGGLRRLRPILPVHPVRAWDRQAPAEGFQTGQRKIAGVTVTPIKPIGGGTISDGGGTAGSSLRRDFPIDSSTRTPVFGFASTSPTVVRTTSGLRSTEALPASPDIPVVGRQQAPYTPNGGQPYPAAGQYRGSRQSNSALPSNQSQRPAEPYSPGERNSPRLAPAQLAPSPQSTRATSRPEHETYTPPPAPPHPTYSSPPAQTPPPAARPTQSAPHPAESGRSSPR